MRTATQRGDGAVALQRWGGPYLHGLGIPLERNPPFRAMQALLGDRVALLAPSYHGPAGQFVALEQTPPLETFLQDTVELCEVQTSI